MFTRWCGDHSYEAASEAIERDWERMVTFYDYPREHWRHLRTTNPVESPFAALRLRPDAARRYKRVDRADSGHLEDVDGGREEVLFHVNHSCRSRQSFLPV